ncbi:MAG: PQQ-binding-like beta-propeller repeat protein, partial [Candidatus Binatia bacterium]
MSVRFSPFGCARLAMRALLAVWLLLGTGARATQRPSQDIRVRGGGGRYMLVRYTTDGTVLQRYTGFGRISDITSYDGRTVLIAEQERDTISAMTLDGQIVWTIALHRPRWIQVLGPNRFLVCQDDPARVVEIDRTGKVFWQLANPLVDAAGAVRMPDGNTAVVEGRSTHHAVHIFSPEGTILWTGREHLAQPRGLVLLPTGELVTSGFDTAQMVFFQPFTTEVRAIGFCCHAEGPRVTKGGDLIAVTPEQQLVHAWTTTGDTAWKFKTFYPPYHVAPLADGTVLVAVFRVPDRQCLHAARAQSVSQRPLAPYWRWLAIGIGPAALVVLMFQAPAVRRWRWSTSNAGAALAGVRADTRAQGGGHLSTLRRVEIGVYTAATTALAFVAAVVHRNLLSEHTVQFWPYAPLVGLGGLFLALLQYRTPPQNSDWTLRMTRLARAPRPTWRMWALWIVGIALLAGSLKGVLDAHGEWVLAPWSAGLVLLAGGAIQEPAARLHIRFRTLAAG